MKEPLKSKEFAMLRLPRHSLRLGLAGILIFGGVVSPVLADSLNHQVQVAADDLMKASKAVTDAQASLADAEKKLPAARAKFATADGKMQVAEGKYYRAKGNLDASIAKLKAVQKKISIKQAQILDLQTKVNEFARSIYQQGQTSQLEIILESKSPSDLTSRLETIKAVSQATSASLRKLVAAKAQLKVDLKSAADEKAKMKGLTDQAAQTLAVATEARRVAYAAKASVNRLVAQRASALKVAEDYKAESRKKYNKLRAEQIRLTQISGSGSHGNGDPQATGPLSWPLPGYAAGGGVGPRTNPYTGQKGCHTGQDIAAPSGTGIHSAGVGIVLYVGWSAAYGNVTMVDHGDGLVTMYAHQSSRAGGIVKGATVLDGQVIGFVGSTGYSTGPHLHFEVHVNGTNYDPMGWFGRSKSVVACAPTRGL